MENSFIITGNITDLFEHRVFYGRIIIEKDRIKEVEILEQGPRKDEPYIIPGFTDAHIHIESSMLVPSEFARMAVVHGTVATVSDPHEIANVCGTQGVQFMIDNGRTVPFKFNFGAPSCVPATIFETAGHALSAEDVDELLRSEDILYLSEMMNFPGVLNQDPEVMAKIESAKKYSKPVDGHAPGLRGADAKKYIDAGISTDHECFTKEEALDKLQHGMHILVREGSAAKNFEALADLLHDHWQLMMFCSDDKHPDSLELSHINELCARAVAKGIDVFKVLTAACKNPVEHYKLKVGLLRKNDFADMVIVEDLEHFKVIKTYINGKLVAENGKSLIQRNSNNISVINNFNVEPISVQDLEIETSKDEVAIDVIEALDGQLITNKFQTSLKSVDGKLLPDLENDILKIVVVNRYKSAPVAKAFIKNFGFKNGAIASSVAHDSHNIVAVGTDDQSICRAINLVIEKNGGVSCSSGNEEMAIALPVAGLMSTDDGYEVSKNYAAIDQAAKKMGSKLSAPFMTLSFMALLVIPHIKLSDLGLFDGDRFEFL
jgi:adenine deaminase